MLKRPTWTLLWGAVAIAWLAVWAVALVWGELNQDEGWYLYAAGMVADGRVPYRDFAFTQGPVMAYAYALGNPLVSSLGLAGGRLLTLVFGLCAVACAVVLAGRLAPASRRTAAMLTVAALAGLNAYQAYFFTVVKTYALTALLVAAGLLLLLEGARGRWLQAAAAGVCLSLAAGTRLSAAFLLPVFLVYLATERGRIGWRPCVGFALGGAVTAAVLFGPFLAVAPDGLWFGLVEYHGSRAGGGASLFYKAGSVARLLQAYTVAAVVAVAVLACRFSAGSLRAAGEWRLEDRFSVAAAAGLAVVALVHLAAPFPYDDYQTFLFPCAAAILARAIAGSLPDSDEEQRVWVAAVALAALLGTAGAPSLQNMFLAGQDRIWWRVRTEPQIVALRRAAATVKGMAGSGDVLLTQDLYLAVEAGMRVPSGLELGPFSYYPDWPDGLAERRRVVNRERLEAIMATGEARVAAFSGYGLAVESPRLTPVPEAERRRLLEVLGRRYEMAVEVPAFGQAGTTLSVYRRREGGEVAK
jgi:hypothetical protein